MTTRQSKHTSEELKELQALPLELKIRKSELRIREWVENWGGEEGVAISFSGGKDSTVLLHLVRNIYPNVKAVFCNTGLEYPEIVEFVKTFDNVDIIKPEKNFKQIVMECGYPLFSKEVSEVIECSKRYIELLTQGESSPPCSWAYRKIKGLGEYKKSMFNCERYQFMLDAPFKVSKKCCSRLKHGILDKYSKKIGVYYFIGTIAEESRLRQNSWIKYGCNMINSKNPMSRPLSFWTEQDILQYLKQYNIPIASIYGEIKEDENGKLYTTGADRTGCIFCGFGCHLDKEPTRFQRLKVTHPKIYNWIMKPIKDGGLGYKEVFDWVNEHSGSKRIQIKYE